MPKLNMPYRDLENAAKVQFAHLKYILRCIEQTGMRPNVKTHPNGMLDTLEILPPHPVTPQVAEIRARNAHSS